MSGWKIVIVDDEPLARYTLRGIIAKHFPEAEIAGEAEDGDTAVEICRALRPDIILMDIKIPGQNGIEAGKEILKTYPEANIIIITAFSDFNDARIAVNAGFTGFLLKPVNTDDFIELIKKVLHRSRKDNNSEKAKQLGPGVRFIIEEFFNLLATGCIEENTLENYLRMMNINFKEGIFVSIGISKKTDSQIEPIVKHLKDFLQKQNIKNVLITKRNEKQAAALLPITPVKNQPISFLQKFIQYVKIRETTNLNIGISKPVSDIRFLSRGFTESEISLDEARYEAPIVSIEQIERRTPQYPQDLETTAIEHLRLKDVAWIKDNKRKIVKSLIPDNAPLHSLKDNSARFLLAVKKVITEKFTISFEHSIVQQIFTADTTDALKKLIYRYLDFVFSYTEESQSKEDLFLKNINKYIDEHIFNEITLEKMADASGLSPAYFSKIFKENTGFTFIDYITQKKVLHAKSMLSQTNTPIKEVGLKLGFQDQTYFSRLFKKLAGITPTEYRQQYRLGSR